jgi:apolipoprotein N-acyltransferase
MRSRRAGLAAVGAGLLVGLSLPPWGVWPLAFAGLVAIDSLIADQPARVRFTRGFLFGLGWLGPGMAWMVFLTVPGYPVAVGTYAAYIGAACAAAGRGRWRWLGLPAAIMIAETVRFAFPFGGVPLASLAISQAAGPFLIVARLGGAILLGGVTVAVAMAIRAAWARAWRASGVMVAVLAVVVAYAALAPRGSAAGTMRVALVQGGGRQGTHKDDTAPGVVLHRHIEASQVVPEGVDLVVWPENVVDIEAPETFATSAAREEIAAVAARVGAPVAVGVTEDVPDRPGRFVNYQILVNPDGSLGARYDKVRRVPFGEYLPLRWIIEHFPGADLVPHDAVAGKGPATLDSPSGLLGVVISWEIFFGGRARDAIGHGGLMLLNPTNGASYRGTILQTQQVASSRLRAVETDRWVTQVSPTGFTAVVTPSGHVVARSKVSEQRVIVATVGLRTGCTPYLQLGDKPVFGLALGLLLVARIDLWRKLLRARSTLLSARR